MNGRIRELMLEAGYTNPEMESRASWLAQLIVNECIKECRDYAATILKFSQFGSNGATDCAKILQQKLKDVG